MRCCGPADALGGAERVCRPVARPTGPPELELERTYQVSFVDGAHGVRAVTLISDELLLAKTQSRVHRAPARRLTIVLLANLG